MRLFLFGLLVVSLNSFANPVTGPVCGHVTKIEINSAGYNDRTDPNPAYHCLSGVTVDNSKKINFDGCASPDLGLLTTALGNKLKVCFLGDFGTPSYQNILNAADKSVWDLSALGEIYGISSISAQ